jgi:hypothetical protein
VNLTREGEGEGVEAEDRQEGREIEKRGRGGGILDREVRHPNGVNIQQLIVILVLNVVQHLPEDVVLSLQLDLYLLRDIRDHCSNEQFHPIDPVKRGRSQQRERERA